MYYFFMTLLIFVIVLQIIQFRKNMRRRKIHASHILRMITEWKVYTFHCTNCDHEWETADPLDKTLCGWCGTRKEVKR